MLASMLRFARFADRRRGPLRWRARFRIEALEGRSLLSGVASITEYPLPDGHSAYALTTGPDGNIWFTEGNASNIGMINTTSHVVTEYAIPQAPGRAAPKPRGITVGPDGNVWFADFGTHAVGKINPTTGAVTEYLLAGNYGGPYFITAGPDGNIWFTWTSLENINPTTGAVTVFSSVGSDSLGSPRGITEGPDGNIWYALSNDPGGVGAINPTTDATAEYAQSLNSGASPYFITAGPDGNLWFTGADRQTGQYSLLASINPATGAMTAFNLPAPNQLPGALTAGSDGNVWFTLGTELASVNPATGAISEYALPNGGSIGGAGITSGPDGNIWFADATNAAIGVATLASNELVVTAQPPASVTAGAPFGLTVEAEDASGNVLSSFNGTVTLALAGGGTLGGTLSATAVNGVATFTGLSLTKAGTGFVIDASASGLAMGASSAITVNPAAAAMLVITTEPPSSVKTSTGFVIVVVITDAYGNVETSDNGSVTVALGNNPTGAKLSGTTIVQAQNGVATFTGLKISKAGKGYTLVATSPGLASVTSTPINVS